MSRNLDSRIVAYLNPAEWQNPITVAAPWGPEQVTEPGLLLDGSSRVLSIPNYGSLGGVWVPGTNAQVSGQGLGPAYLSGSSPGLGYTLASKQTLKLFFGTTVAGPLSFASRPQIALFCASSTVAAVCAFLAVGADSAGTLNGINITMVASGAVSAVYTDSALTQEGPSSAAGAAMSGNHVMSTVVSTTGTILRLDGVQVGTAARSANASFLCDEICVGQMCDKWQTQFTPAYSNQTIGACAVVMGTLSTADIQYFEALVGSSLGVILPGLR
jgi:hypothetical protein